MRFVAGIHYIDPVNWTGIPPEARPWVQHRVDARGESASAAACLLIGILLASLLICTALYIGVSVVLTGVEPYPEIDPHASVASAFARKGGTFGRISTAVVAIGALAGMTSVLLVTFQGQARIFLAMSRDGLLPTRVFGTIHPRFRTPHLSTAVTGGTVAAVAAVTPAEALSNMVCIGTLMAFAVVWPPSAANEIAACPKPPPSPVSRWLRGAAHHRVRNNSLISETIFLDMPQPFRHDDRWRSPPCRPCCSTSTHAEKC